MSFTCGQLHRISAARVFAALVPDLLEFAGLGRCDFPLACRRRRHRIPRDRARHRRCLRARAQAVAGRGAILGLVLAPLVLPRIIIAVALFYLYAQLGLLGSILGLVLGHTMLAVPYVLITVMAVLHDL